jgi:hypothetical protein
LPPSYANAMPRQATHKPAQNKQQNQRNTLFSLVIPTAYQLTQKIHIRKINKSRVLLIFQHKNLQQRE